VGQEAQFLLGPKEESNFNWTAYKGEHLVQIALSDKMGNRSPFCGGFRIDEVGETLLRCGDPERVLEVVNECQRRRTPVNDFSASALFPTDYHGEWSDERMERKLKNGVASVALPPRWDWVEPAWHWSHPSADERPTDADGWEYAINWDTPFSPKVFTLALVRRRRWVRHRRPKQKAADNLEERTVVIEVTFRGPSVLINISDGNVRPPPYIIHNLSSEPLFINQKGNPLRRRTVQSGHRVHFCWDEPAGKRLLEMRSAHGPRVSEARQTSHKVEVRLDEVGERDPLKWGKGQLLLRVSAHGNTRTLTVSDVSEVPAAAEEEVTHLHLFAEVKGIGLSLVRSGVRELAYFCVSDLSLELYASSLANRVALAIGEIRLDNQAHDAQLPAVLIRTSIVNRQHTLMDSDAKKDKVPFVHLIIVKKTANSSKSALTDEAQGDAALGDEHVFPYAGLNIDEFELRIEESFIESLFQFVVQLRFGSSESSSGGGGGGGGGRPSRRRVSMKEETSLRHSSGSDVAVGTAINWYFKRLRLSPIKVNLTYVHGQRVLNEIFRNKLLIPNLDRAPLVLNGLALLNTFKTPQQLANNIANNYKNALLRQIYKLLLQIDALGNPAGFVRGLGAGVKDFFLLPGEALFKGPENFGRGVVNGTWALTRSVLGGTFKASSQITGGLGRLAGTFSMDANYVRDRQQTQPKPRHVVQGLMTGSAGLGRGVMEGLTGLISAPIEGAQSHGVAGLLKGIGKGVVGAVVKPTAGMFDLATCTAEGIANTFDFLEESRADSSEGERMRPPRMMHGPERAIRPYSRWEAIAQRVLLQLREGAHVHEALHMCAQLKHGELVVLTSGRLLVASTTTFRTTRQFPLLAIRSVQMKEANHAVELVLKAGPGYKRRAFSDHARFRHLFKRTSIASAISEEELPLDPLAGPEVSAHCGRVTRYSRWSKIASMGSSAIFSRSDGSEHLSSRISRGSSASDVALAAASGSSRDTQRRPDHEIECPDLQTARALQAALVIALSPEVDDKKRVSHPRNSAAAPRPLLTTTSTLCESAKLEALELAAMLAASEAEGAHGPASAPASESASAPAAAPAPAAQPARAPARKTAFEAHVYTRDLTSRATDMDSRTFEMSHRISRHLRSEMGNMPDVSTQLMPELSLGPVRVPHARESRRCNERLSSTARWLQQPRAKPSTDSAGKSESTGTSDDTSSSKAKRGIQRSTTSPRLKNAVDVLALCVS